MARLGIPLLSALVLSVTATVPIGSASAKTWTDWHYDTSVDPKTNVVSSKAEVVVKEGDKEDLYSLSIFCAGKKFAVSFRSATRHFKTGNIEVTWKPSPGKRHDEKHWQVLEGANQVIYAESPQDLMFRMLKGKKFEVRVADAMGEPVRVTFPVFGVQPTIEDALSSCSGKDGAKFRRFSVERDAFYLLLSTNGGLIYPLRARQKWKQGRADVSFDITEKGTVTNAAILSEDPPDWGFGEAAVATVERWKYKPELRDGKPAKRVGIQMRLSFKLSSP